MAKFLASGGHDCRVRLWDPRTGRHLRALAGHTAYLNCIALSRDGRLLASAGRDHDIRVWDVAAGKEVRRLRGHTDQVDCVAFSPDGKLLASGCMAHTVRVWDLAAGNERRRLLDGPSPGHFVHAVAFSPGGKYLVAGDTDCKVYVWEVATWKRLRTLEGHTDCIIAAVFLPGGRRLLTGGHDSTVRLWDVVTGKELRRYGDEKDLISSLALSPGGKRVAAGTVKGMVHVWDVETGKERLRWRAGAAAAVSVAFSPDGKVLASVSPWSHRIELWDAAAGKRLLPTADLPGAARQLAFSPDGNSLAVVHGTGPYGLAGEVRVWDIRTGRPLSRADPGAWVGALTFTPGRKLVLLASDRRGDGLHVWDVSERKPLARLTGRRWGQPVALSHNGEVVSCVQGEDLLVWDRTSGKEVIHPGGAPHSCHALAFAPDGTALAVAGQAGVSLYAPPGGKRLRNFGEQPGWSGFVAFSPDGRTVAASGPGRRCSAQGMPIDTGLYLWESATGRQRLRLLGHREQLATAAFSPDGRLLASASRGAGVRLWDLTTGKQVGRLGGHHGWVNALAFSPDGKTLASAGEDSTVLLWDVARVAPARKPPAGRLSRKELDGLWRDLADEDAGKAYRAAWALADRPAQAVPFLRERLREAPSAKLRYVGRWIAELDSEEFDARENATRDLAGLGKLAEPALREALKRRPSPEAGARLKRLLARLEGAGTPPDVLRLWRAQEALERAGTPEALRLRKSLGGRARK